MDSHKENQKSEELTSDVSVSVREKISNYCQVSSNPPPKKRMGVNYPRGINTKERRRAAIANQQQRRTEEDDGGQNGHRIP